MDAFLCICVYWLFIDLTPGTVAIDTVGTLYPGMPMVLAIGLTFLLWCAFHVSHFSPSDCPEKQAIYDIEQEDDAEKDQQVALLLGSHGFQSFIVSIARLSY